jgi:hypothetical protein
LADLGRREAALAASQESVDIHRALAEERPDAFLPDLGTSLITMAEILAGAERYAEAAASAQEGVAMIVAFSETQPAVWADLADALVRTYTGACERARIEPDRTLLQRIAAAVGRSQDFSASDPVLVAFAARIQAIVKAAQETGSLDEEVLAQLPPEVATHIRAVWAAQMAQE